ncbi:hypothetical protein MKX03_024602, partial [Papaver bracteatum]
FASGKGLSGIKTRKTKSRTETSIEQDCPTEKLHKKDDENVRKRKGKGGPNLQEVPKKTKAARKLLKLRKSPLYKDMSQPQRALLSPFFDKETS